MKSSTFNLRLSHYIFVMVFIAIGLITAVFFVFNSFLNRAKLDAIAKAEADLVIASSKIEHFILRAETIVDITAKTIEYMMKNGAGDDELKKYLFDQSIVYRESINKNYTAMYGVFKEKYVDGSAWSPPPEYDPKQRPWYILPMATPGKTVIVPPYVDADTGAMIISISKVLADGISVLAHDIRLDEIETFADDLYHGSGFAFILDNEGRIVSHKNRAEIGRNYLTSDIDNHMSRLVKQIIRSPNGSQTITLGKDDCIVFTNRVPCNWRAVVVVNQSVLFHSLKKLLYYGMAAAIGVISILWTFLIISFRNLNQERDRAVAAEKSKSYFFATVSHDIRTPLNSIIGFSELLKQGITDPRVANEYFDHIIFSGNTLMLLINDVLDLAKLDAGKMQYSYNFCDFSKLVKHVTRSFEHVARNSELTLECRIPEYLPELKIDEQRIRQILFNLVGNAVKFTPRGKITIHTSLAPGRGNCGILTFSVQDTGIGIAPKDIEKLLKPFVQLNSKIQGTGLGLSICNVMLKQMGGTLSIESQPGSGSIFTVTMDKVEFRERSSETADPLTESSGISQAATVAPAMLPHGRALSLLIVDDIELNLKVLSALCKKSGISDCVTASSGKAALSALDTRSFDAVLTDVWMQGMNGDELLAQIRRRPKTADLPVYAVTADVEKISNWRKIGYTGLLLKPITTVRLLEFIKELQQHTEMGNKE
ncbi:MAG: ATP-binding protein [Victivallaceae bacterium]|nr:ATP-binding protein [Victivallaceae bacterium]